MAEIAPQNVPTRLDKAPANASQRYEVRRADLPLSCPTPAKGQWNSHPRVYVAVEKFCGEA